MRRANSLLIGCAAAALLAAPAAVRAQAFTASPTTVAGSVTYDRATPGVETITVNTPSAIINWEFVSPIGNPIVFLPAGNTATFQNSVNIPNFAVLNRIIPAGAPIAMNGNVISQLQTMAGTVRGGTVIFSSPTGIIVGPTAVFDVGRLMLTSLDPLLNAGGEFLVGGNIILTDGSAFPNAAIVTQAGSQFRAPAEGSWVVFAAPQVTHGGSVRVNGSAAYVGAEIASITINEGLFDIDIFTGSTQANPVVHTGSTGGPASTGAPDNHMIAMVASPNATPMTMLLSGSVGFDAAVSAAIENGAIVLSAGHDIVGTQINPRPDSDIPASARITGGTFTSDVTGRARSEFIAGNTGAGTLSFTQDVSLAGYDRAHLTADQGFAITVGGNASLSAANLLPVRFSPEVDVTGGEALLRAGSGSSITIAGSAIIDASARGGIDDPGIAGSGTGGRALVAADKGNVDIAGSLTILSTGTGSADPQFPPPARGGDGTGGTALASGLSGGTLHVGGNLLIDATGTGSAGTGATPSPGSIGTGGTARVEAVAAGAVRIDGATTAIASGVGGPQDGAAPNTGGTGQGGTAAVQASGGTIDLTGPVVLTADGSGGSGPQGGTGAGGTAFVEALAGQATLTGAAQLRANGTGGAGATQGTAAGGALLVRAISPAGGAPASVAIGALDGTSLATGNPAGGNQLGRWIVTADRGTIQLGTANLTASANTVPAAPTASEFQLQNGIVTVAGQGNFLTDGEIRLSAAGTGRLGGGNILFNGRAGIFLTHNGGAAGAFTVDVGNFTAITLGDYLAAAGTAVRGTGVDIRAGRNAVLAQTNATGLLSVNAGNDVTVAAAATGADIRIAAGKDVRIGAGGSIGDAATATVSVQAAQNYTAAAGTVVRGGTIDIRAGQTATLAQTNAVAALNVTAGGTARFNSAVTGGQITIASADIDVPAGGSIGNAGTTLVSLLVQPQANETSLGGAAQGPGYSLTEAEAGRLQGAIVRVSAPGGAAGLTGSSRIVVRNLTMSAGAVQAFEIVTPGTVRVDGGLLLANAGAANRIGITAGGRVEVAAPGGGIRVRDAAGAPAGSLTVAAADIWATDVATLGQLAGDPNFAGRDQALETNAGADAPRGWIEAGAITLAPRTTLFVQNSGTAAAFGGLTVGTGRLTIRPSGNAPATVFAFGRRLNPDGSFTTNVPFFFQVDYSFANTPGYTDESEFNRCLINNPRCGAPFGGVPGGSRDFVLRSFPIPPQEPPGDVVDEDAFAADPLIEEPVTSGSDSTLWIGPDDDDDDDEDDDDDDDDDDDEEEE